MEGDIQITEEAVLGYRMRLLPKAFVEFSRQIDKAQAIAEELDRHITRRVNALANGLAQTSSAVDSTLGFLADFQRTRNDFESIIAEFQVQGAEYERLVRKYGRYASTESMQDAKRRLRWLSIRADGYEELLKVELENICLAVELDRKRCLVLATQAHFLFSAVSFERQCCCKQDEVLKSSQYAQLLEQIKDLEEQLILTAAVMQQVSVRTLEIYAPLLKTVESSSSQIRRLSQ